MKNRHSASAPVSPPSQPPACKRTRYAVFLHYPFSHVPRMPFRVQRPPVLSHERVLPAYFGAAIGDQAPHWYAPYLRRPLTEEKLEKARTKAELTYSKNRFHGSRAVRAEDS